MGFIIRVGWNNVYGTQMTQTVRRSDAFGNADFRRFLLHFTSIFTYFLVIIDGMTLSHAINQTEI